MSISNGLHRLAQGAEVHTPFTFVYADDAARLAATGFGPTDVQKIALQLSDATAWILLDDSPITWSSWGNGDMLKSAYDSNDDGIVDGADIAGDIDIDSLTEETSPTSGDMFILSRSGARLKVDLDNLPSGGGGGGRSLIASVTPTGVGTVTVASSIVATYKKLTLEFAIRSTQSANVVNGYLQFNNDTTSGNYYYAIHRTNGFGASNDVGANYLFASAAVPAANANASGFIIGKIDIIQYANSNFKKVALISWGTTDNGFYQQAHGALQWLSTSAINRVDVVLSAGNFDTNSVINLYGDN